MSSYLRNLQRRFSRSRPDYEPKPQPTIMRRDGGYTTLHPTKGWRSFTGARLKAQRVMAGLLDHVTGSRRKKPAKVWRKPAKVPPSTLTRQQCRYAKRKGLSS